MLFMLCPAVAVLAEGTLLPGKDGKELFKVFPAKSLVKVPRDRPFDRWSTDKITLSAARDETESFQLVIVPGTNGLRKVFVKPCELSNGNVVITVECNFVEYVETINPKNTKPTYVGWWPDILMPDITFEVQAVQQQPVWMRINVHEDAAPGLYNGKVTISGDGHEVSVPVTLRVRDFRIPRPGTLACPFGLYPGTMKQWYGTQDSENKAIVPLEDFARWCEFLGKYRLTPKNIGREYGLKQADGNSWNLKRLKITVGAFSEKYYPDYSFAAYRLPNPSQVLEGKIKKDIEGWITELKQRNSSYRQLGLPGKVFLYGMDEATEEALPLVRETYTRIHEVSPEERIMQTLNHAPPEKLVGLVDIWCPLSPRLEEKHSFYTARKKAGDTVWMYVCCVPCETYVNFFIDEPAIDHRILFWQAWKRGVTGLLYWSTTWWEGLEGPASGKPHFPDVPIHMRDTVVAQTTKNNGDGLLIWPGPDMTPYPSIRLEIIRDGIEDYEYFVLLDEQIKRLESLKKNDPKVTGLLAKASELLIVPEYISKRFSSFTKNPEDIEQRRKLIGDMIEALMVIE